MRPRRSIRVQSSLGRRHDELIKYFNLETATERVGHPAYTEKRMAETSQHKSLVRGLVDWMGRQGVRITHAVGDSALPDPPAHGRHEPDAVGTKDSVIWIGEAKIGGADLTTEHSLEQLRDFSNRQMSSSAEPCPFVLCVSPEQVEAARGALRLADANLENTTIIA